LYLIVVSIIRRKAIHKAKTYITSIAISFVVVAVSGVLALGGFGYSTYVPDVDDVEMATISGLPVSPVYNALPNDISMDVFSADSYNSAKGMGIFTDEDDIEAFVNVANGLVADSDNEADCDIRVMYRLKNGKTVYRYYSSAGADSIYNVLSLTDTKAYNDELEYLLCGNDEDSELKKNIEKFDLDDSDYFDYSYEISGEKNAKKSIQGGYVGLEYSDGAYKSIDNTYELREALAKDFKASTYNDKFKNENQPICELKFSPNYDDDSDDVYFYGSTVSYHIYPTMTNTVNYLKSINAYKDSTLLAKYDVESAYVTKMSSAIDEYGYNLNTGLYFGGYISCDFSEDIDYTYFYDEIKRVYGEDGKTQDADTIKKYLSVAKPFGYVNGDDYAVVFIVKNSDGIEDFIPMFISQKDME
jgi:hypothetical protein